MVFDMMLPRLQLFEFNDAPWAPPVVRGMIVDALGVALADGRLLDGLVEPFVDFIHAAGSDHILDLCAGTGTPARVLLDALDARGFRPRLTLTDLHPRVAAWEAIAAARPGQVDFAPTSVDATAVPRELEGAGARVIINALHHLPPALVAGILADAVRQRRSIFIAEGFGRDPLGLRPFLAPGLKAIFTTPLRGSWRDRALRAALVWGSPLGLAVSAWDSLVSTLRIYSEDELRALVAPLGDDFEWRFGWFPVGRAGRGCWFSGVPREARA